MLRPVKDNLGPKVPGLYCMSSECGHVYLGQSGRSFNTRCKEHTRHIRLCQPETSAVAEHRFETGHTRKINCRSSSIPKKATVYMVHVIKEAIYISFTPATSTGMVASCSVSPGT
jgi:predicted GIY-YIG superfamily endonuclease